MNFDLVPIKERYRGMGRILQATDILNKKSKNNYEMLLEEYFKFLEYSEATNKQSFEVIITFYERLKEYDIKCEIIAYHEDMIEEVFGYSLEFLGIDIVHNMCESLISEEVDPLIEELINGNGLCNTIKDVEKIIPYQDHGEVEWKPCYVYKVIL